MPGRQFNANSYKYGFNGKENDPETGTQDYGLRIYNPSLGRFLSIDPLTKDYPWYTPYQFAGNKPIKCSDVDGAEENDQSTYVYKPKPLITKLDANTIYKLKQEKLHMMINEYAKVLLETKGIKINAERLFNSFLKILRKADNAVEGNGGKQNSGLALEAPTNGGDGTKIVAISRDVPVINIDLLLAYTGSALKSAMKVGGSDPLTPASIIGNVATATQEAANMAKKDDASRDEDSVDVKIQKFNGDDSLQYKAKRGEENQSVFDESKRSTPKPKTKTVTFKKPILG